MAFAPPQSGWTAMSLAPNPDKFAAASVNIDRVSSGTVAPVFAAPPVASPVTSPAYQQLQSQIFGGSTMAPLAQQQLQATQQAAMATAAPANAYAAVEKSLQAEPWTKPSATTMPQSNFLSPTTGAKVPQSGWVGSLPQI